MPITHAEFLAMQARTQKKPAEPTAYGVEMESDLHDAILKSCADRNWIAVHARMDKKTTTTPPGVSDFIILHPSGRTLLVEAKARREKQRPEQRGFQLWAEQLGHKYYLVRTHGEFLAIINAL